MQFEHLYFPTIDSTNEEARRRLNAATPPEKPLILRSGEQSAGRGTRGRRWISPPGAGLYFSILHPLDNVNFSESLNRNALAQLRNLPLSQTPLLTLAAGVACAQILRELTHVLVELKPINDLYVKGLKLGGILTESLVSDTAGTPCCRGIITGIGINLKSSQQVDIGCAEEIRTDDTNHSKTAANQPTSIEAEIPAGLFARWNPEALKIELSEAIASRVTEHYIRLAQGEDILSDYALLKISGSEVPTPLQALLQHTHLV